MPVTVTMQLNAINHAGDWATRSAGRAGTGTGALGARTRQTAAMRAEAELAVRLNGLRGAVESMRRGVGRVTIADTATAETPSEFGTPAMYCGIRFAIA